MRCSGGLLAITLTAYAASSTPAWNWRRAQELSEKDSLRKQTVSEKNREPLLRAIKKELQEYWGSVPLLDGESVDESALRVRIRLVDLNSDGVPEVIAQPSGIYCSPTGNCPIWIFERAGSEYKQVLEDTGATQTFTVTNERS